MGGNLAWVMLIAVVTLGCRPSTTIEVPIGACSCLSKAGDRHAVVGQIELFDDEARIVRRSPAGASITAHCGGRYITTRADPSGRYRLEIEREPSCELTFSIAGYSGLQRVAFGAGCTVWQVDWRAGPQSFPEILTEGPEVPAGGVNLD